MPVFQLKLGFVPVPIDQNKRILAAALNEEGPNETPVPSAEPDNHILRKWTIHSITHLNIPRR